MDTDLPEHVQDLFWRTASDDAAAGERRPTLGSDGGGTFVVDDHEAVRWEAHERPQPSRFVNASVDLFAVFLLTVKELRDVVRGLQEDDALRAISEARDQLRTRDSAAFADGDTWWAVVFEQLDDGLL